MPFPPIRNRFAIENVELGHQTLVNLGHEQGVPAQGEKVIEHAYLICLGRRPTTAEQKTIISLYESELERFQRDPQTVKTLTREPLNRP